jgi:hypothetical protein
MTHNPAIGARGPFSDHGARPSNGEFGGTPRTNFESAEDRFLRYLVIGAYIGQRPKTTPN